MNQHATPTAKALRTLKMAALAAAFAVVGCDPAPEAQIEPPLAGSNIGGDFELTSSGGETVRWDDFEGRYRIVYFGYAYCPDICPVDMSRMARGLAKFAESDPARAAKIQPIFISIDPARDTPEVLEEFTKAFGDDIIGLTGTKAQLDAAVKNFAAYYSRGIDLDNGHYLMDHSNTVLLFDPEGQPLAILPTDIAGSEGTEAVAQELAKWVS